MKGKAPLARPRIPRRRGEFAAPRGARLRGPDRHRPVRHLRGRGRADQHARPRPPAARGSVKNTGTDPVWVVSSTLSRARRLAVRGHRHVRDRGGRDPLAANETCTVVVEFRPTSTGAKSAVLTTVTNGPTFTTGAITGLRAQAVGGGAGGLRRPARRRRRPSARSGSPTTAPSPTRWARSTVVRAVRQGDRRLRVDDARRRRLVRRGGGLRADHGGVKTGVVTIANHKPHLIALAGVGTEAVAALAPAVADVGDGPADVHAAQHRQRGAGGRARRASAPGFAVGADGVLAARRSRRARRAR